MAAETKERPRVLVVDDDDDFQAVVQGFLDAKYEVLGLPSGDGLVDQLSTLRPDLLVLDIQLPGPNGFELCRTVRSDRRFQTLPVLFLTASGADGDFAENLDSGGTAYLTKPVSRRQLLSKLRQLLAV